jgi:hypothetical protein
MTSAMPRPGFDLVIMNPGYRQELPRVIEVLEVPQADAERMVAMGSAALCRSFEPSAWLDSRHIQLVEREGRRFLRIDCTNRPPPVLFR